MLECLISKVPTLSVQTFLHILDFEIRAYQIPNLALSNELHGVAPPSGDCPGTDPGFGDRNLSEMPPRPCSWKIHPPHLVALHCIRRGCNALPQSRSHGSDSSTYSRSRAPHGLRSWGRSSIPYHYVIDPKSRL